MSFVTKIFYYICPKKGNRFRLYTLQCITCDNFVDFDHVAEKIICNYQSSEGTPIEHQ